MKWSNLKQNKCPQCGKSLGDHYDPVNKFFRCPCGFNIGEARYKQIVSKMVTRNVDKEKHYRPEDENPDY